MNMFAGSPPKMAGNIYDKDLRNAIDLRQEKNKKSDFYLKLMTLNEKIAEF